MLCQDAGWVGLRNLALRDANHAVTIAHEARFLRGNELWIVDRLIGQVWFWGSLKSESGAGGEQRDGGDAGSG